MGHCTLWRDDYRSSFESLPRNMQEAKEKFGICHIYNTPSTEHVLGAQSVITKPEGALPGFLF